jgi:LacI family transcriptional regulator
MPRKIRPPVVALLIETSNAFSRELLHGIRDWMRANTAWTIHLSEQGRGNRPPAWLKDWRGDGIIARVENSEIARAVRQCGVPVVNVSASGAASDLPTIISDSAAIAHLAAKHLMERGFKHFAYCGDSRFAWSRQHGIHFAAQCADAGAVCDVFPSTGGDDELLAIRRWLAKLPHPVGIMTCYDIRGQQVLDACRKLGLRVPDEVAVISQHNDELLCELCDPPLSSVIPGARKVGLEAAALLSRLMKSRKQGAGIITIPPIGVATRQSTDIIAVDDPRLANAARYIRSHACSPMQITDVMKASGLSRTLLERLFRKHFGVSPYEQALRHRIAIAEQMLRTTTLSIAEVAERVGFSTVEHFTTTYTRRLGRSPGATRKSE